MTIQTVAGISLEYVAALGAAIDEAATTDVETAASAADEAKAIIEQARDDAAFLKRNAKAGHSGAGLFHNNVIVPSFVALSKVTRAKRLLWIETAKGISGFDYASRGKPAQTLWRKYAQQINFVLDNIAVVDFDTLARLELPYGKGVTITMIFDAMKAPEKAASKMEKAAEKAEMEEARLDDAAEQKAQEIVRAGNAKFTMSVLDMADHLNLAASDDAIVVSWDDATYAAIEGLRDVLNARFPATVALPASEALAA